MGLISWIDRTFSPKFERNWDDKMFREAIQPFNSSIGCA